MCFGVDCLLWEQSFISVNLRKEPLFDSKRTSAFDCEYELILNIIISKLFLRINGGEKCNVNNLRYAMSGSLTSRGERVRLGPEMMSQPIVAIQLRSHIEESIGKSERK